MKPALLLFMAVVFLLLTVCPTHAFRNSRQDQKNLLRPYRENAYGPGINADATGRAFKWRTRDEQDLEPDDRVKQDAYGPGVGMDRYGRPVKARPW